MNFDKFSMFALNRGRSHAPCAYVQFYKIYLSCLVWISIDFFYFAGSSPLLLSLGNLTIFLQTFLVGYTQRAWPDKFAWVNDYESLWWSIIPCQWINEGNSNLVARVIKMNWLRGNKCVSFCLWTVDVDMPPISSDCIQIYENWEPSTIHIKPVLCNQ